MNSWIGVPLPRREDDRLVRGQGRFVDDIHLPGMVHLHVLRSPHANARISRIATAEALKLSGVLAVLTYDDLGVAAQPLPLQIPLGQIRHRITQPPLAAGHVAYVGQPVAAVVATDRYVAEDAAELIEVTYEPRTAATDLRRALEPGSPLAHPELGDNLAGTWQQSVGDPEGALGGAEHRLELEFCIARGTGHPMETRGCVARWEPDTGLTFWGSHQTPHRTKRELMTMLGLPGHLVRVMTPDVGGGFGIKGPFYPEDALVAVASMQVGRPVKWIEDRREHAMAAIQDREQIHRVQVGFRADGTLVSLIDRYVYDTGAYIPYGLLVGVVAGGTLPGPYKIPNLHLEFRAALTNKASVAAYRGAGRPQGVFVMERTMDRIADYLGLDPALVRERNLIQPGEFPYRTGLTSQDNLPQEYDSANHPEALRLCKEMVGHAEFRERQAEARREGRYLGLGIAMYVEGCGVGPFEGASVSVDTVGRVTVSSGVAAQGQGHETMFSQLVAHELGLAPDQVYVRAGDTAAITHGVGTYASRVAVTAGNAAAIAARRVRELALKLAAEALEADPADLVCQGGRVYVRGAESRQVGLGELARVATPARGSLPVPGQPGLAATEYFEPGPATSATGVHGVIVAVDPQSCLPRIEKYVVVHDCGTVINPLIVDGQVHGGVAQGIGGSLYEKIIYDENGQLLTGTLMDYLLPTACEVPHVEVAHMETPSPFNPLGVKGAGEGGTLPAYAAIARAVEDALAPFGVKIDAMPVLPADLHRMIQNLR